SLDTWRSMMPTASAVERTDALALIQAQAATVDLAEAEPAWGDDAGARVAALGQSILELEYSLTPHGLHIGGSPAAAAERAELLDAAGVIDMAQRASLDALLAEDHET